MGDQMGTGTVGEHLLDVVKRFDLPGLSAAFAAPGRSVGAWAAGWSDSETGEKLTPQHRMGAGSVGKTFTAATALALSQQGLIDLDASVADYLDDKPWFPRLSQGDRITLRMLLNHTAGIPDHRASPAFAAAIRVELLAETPNFDLYFPPAKLLSFILDEPAAFTPGSDFQYSETGYILAGMLIEQASGEQYYELVKRLFLEPLELDQTQALDRRDLGMMSQGYIAANDLGFPDRTLERGHLTFNPSTEWTGGGFLSTPRDLARWAGALFTGQALEKPYLNELLDCRPTDTDPDVRYGLGCYLWNTKYGPAYGHSGEMPGYRSIMAYYPSMQASLAIQINSSIPPHRILPDLLGSFATVVFDTG